MKACVLLSVAAVCLVPVSAQAQGECILNRSEIIPVMQPAPHIRSSYSAEWDHKHQILTETLTLENGLKITYSVGGCVHYGFLYTFEDIPEEIVEQESSYELTIALLRLVPGFTVGSNNDFAHLFRHLKGETYESFSCGDAWCSFKRENSRVQIGYDFPL